MMDNADIILIKENERNYGVDLLRIVAMYMIVLLHVLGQGGVLSHAVPMSAQWITGWFIEVLSCGAVNCYAMISGYVGYHLPVRLEQLITLWLQTLFYTLGITVIFYLFVPGCSISIKVWIDSLFPFIRGHYWYMSAFFGIFFFRPFLNRCVQTMEYTQFKKLFVSVLIGYSLLPTLFHYDTLRFHSGASAFWLLVLYIVGGGMAKFGNNISLKQARLLRGFSLMTLIAWLSVIVIVYINMKVTGSTRGTNYFVSYTSPFIFLGSCCLVAYFANMYIGNSFALRLIRNLAQATLGVYLIHSQVLIWDRYFKNFANAFANDNFVLMIVEVLGSGCLIYVGCSLVDMGRGRLFKRMRTNSFVNTLACELQGILGWN